MGDILHHNLALSTACMNNNKENNHNHNADKMLPWNKRIMKGRYVNSEREKTGIYQHQGGQKRSWMPLSEIKLNKA